MKEHIDAALASLDAMIRTLLDGDEKGRYLKIAKICGQAAHLLKMLPASTRVAVAQAELGNGGVITTYRNTPLRLETFPDEDIHEAEMGVHGGILPQGHIRMVNHGPGAEPSITDLAREVLSSTLPAILRIGEKRPEPFADLARMLDVRDRLIKARMDTRTIDKQIKVATAALDKESTNAVVPPLVLRGHQAGDAGREDDRPRGETDPPGEGGTGEAPDARAQEKVDIPF